MGKLKLLHKKTDEQGFSLVEIMVAILIGAIVLSIAIATLVAINTSSLRVMARAEVQENTRRALSLAFSEVSDAEALPRCILASTQAAQLLLEDPEYPPDGFDVGDCEQTASSGEVVAYASPNRLCYFSTDQSDDGEKDMETTTPNIKCIAQGGGPSRGAGATVLKSSVDGIDDCVTSDILKNHSPRNMYLYECKGSSDGNLIVWPISYSVDTDSLVLLAELGELDSDEPGGSEPGAFEYISYDSVVDTPKDIIGVKIDLTAGFDSKIASEQRRNYVFKQTVLLRGSEYYQQENANEYQQENANE